MFRPIFTATGRYTVYIKQKVLQVQAPPLQEVDTITSMKTIIVISEEEY
jgi:hypothetical protein